MSSSAIGEKLYEELKHQRLIHFALVALCSVNLYFVILAYSNVDDLAREVDDLTQIIGRLDTNENRLRFLVEQNKEDIDRRGITVKQDVQSLVERHTEVNIPNVALRTLYETKEYPSKFNLSDSSSLAAIKDALGGMVAKLEIVNHLVELDDAVIKDFRKAAPRIQSVDGPVRVSFKVKQWPDSANATGNGELEVIRYATRRPCTAKDLTLDPPFRDCSDEGPERLVSGYVAFRTDALELRLHQQWFESRFPQMTQAWGDLKEKIWTEVQNDAWRKRFAGLPAQRLEVLTLEVRAQDIGFLGPILIIAALFYLVVYGSHLEVCLSRSPAGPKLKDITLNWKDGFVSPWIGAMPGQFGCVASISTLVLIPTITVACSFLTLTKLDSPVVAVIGILPAALGLKGFCRGASLGKEIFGDTFPGKGLCRYLSDLASKVRRLKKLIRK